MWSWNQFRNLPKNQGLSAQEQAIQYNTSINQLN